MSLPILTFDFRGNKKLNSKRELNPAWNVPGNVIMLQICLWDSWGTSKLNSCGRISTSIFFFFLMHKMPSHSWQVTHFQIKRGFSTSKSITLFSQIDGKKITKHTWRSLIVTRWTAQVKSIYKECVHILYHYSECSDYTKMSGWYLHCITYWCWVTTMMSSMATATPKDMSAVGSRLNAY